MLPQILLILSAPLIAGASMDPFDALVLFELAAAAFVMAAFAQRTAEHVFVEPFVEAYLQYLDLA
jgi:hypothetical protein